MSAAEPNVMVLPAERPTSEVLAAQAKADEMAELDATVARLSAPPPIEEPASSPERLPKDEEDEGGLSLARVLDFVGEAVQVMQTGSVSPKLASETEALVGDVAKGVTELGRAAVRSPLKTYPQAALRALQVPGQMWQELVFGKGGPLEDLEGLEELKVKQRQLQDEIGVEIDRPESTTGQVAEELFSWIIPFKQAKSAVEGLGFLSRLPAKVAKFLESPTALALAAGFLADPLGDLIDKIAAENPDLADPIRAALEAEEGKPLNLALERLKEVAVGFLAGVAIDGLIVGIKTLRKIRLAKAARKAEAERKPREEPEPAISPEAERVTAEQVAIGEEGAPAVRAVGGTKSAARIAEAEATINRIYGDTNITREELHVRAQAMATELKVNLEVIEKPEDVVNLIDDATRIFDDQIQKARRGTISNEETYAEASRLASDARLNGTKVVDSSGRPRRVYHGTGAEFDQFDVGMAKPGLFGDGLYFTENPVVASGYAKGATPNVRMSYLDIKNPFDADASFQRSGGLVEQIARKLDERGYDGAMFEQVLSEASHRGAPSGTEIYDAARVTKNAAGEIAGSPAVNRILSDLGFDGITHVGGDITGGARHRVWIAFKSSQAVEAGGREAVEAAASDTQAAAKFFDVDANTLLERNHGEAYNAAQTIASVRVWADVAKQVDEILAEASTNNSTAIQVKMRRALAVFGAISSEVMGIRAEAGRALQIWKQAWRDLGGDAERALRLQQLIEQNGGKEVNQELAQQMRRAMTDGLSPRQLAEAANKLNEKGLYDLTADAIAESIISGYLWLPTTYITNQVSPYVMLAAEIAERAVAQRIGQFTTLPGEDAVVAGEAQALAEGAARGIRMLSQYLPDAEMLHEAVTQPAGVLNGIKGFFSLWAQRWKGDAVSPDKYDAKTGAIKQIAEKLPEGYWTPLLKFYGSLTSVPSRALRAQDIVSHGVMYEASRQALAMRHATQAGGSAEQIAAKYADLVANPPEWLRIKASEEAQRLTFMEKPGIGPKAGVGAVRVPIAEILRKGRRAPVLGPLIVPFVDVLANMTRQSLERTPFAPVVAQWRNSVNQGGAERDMALARAAMGTAAIASCVDLAESGYVTGRYPSDPGDREAWQRLGKTANSVRIGDKWFSTQALGPVGFMLSTCGTLNQAIREREIDEDDHASITQIMGAMIQGAEQAIESQTVAKGIAQASDAIRRQDEGALRWTERQMQSVVPLSTPLRFVRRATDPSLPDYSSHFEAVEAMIPLWEQTLPRKRDMWGHPIADEEEFGRAWSLLSPFRVSREKDSPIDREMVNNHMNIEGIRKKTTFDAGTRTVDVEFREFPRVFEKYVELAGHGLDLPGSGTTGGAQGFLNAVVTGEHPLSKVYERRSGGRNGKKRDFVFLWVQRFRSAAQRAILDPNGEFQDAEFVRFRQYVSELEEKAKARDLQRKLPQ